MKQTPQAYLWRFKDGEYHSEPFASIEDAERECAGYDGEPVALYLKQEPITKREIDLIPKQAAPEWLEETDFWSFFCGVRWAEKRHGIARKDK